MNLLTDLTFNQLHFKIGSKHASIKGKKDSDLNELTLSDILEMVGDGNCQYTGEAFKNIGDATFERVNPSLGYVKGNVLMVSLAANQHKSRLDCFVKEGVIPDAMKIKLLRKALYQLEKKQ